MGKIKKNSQSTYDEIYNSLSPQEKATWDEEYRELVLSEMILAAMEKDEISVRRLAKEADISPTIVQGIRSGKRKITVVSLFKIFNALGYTIFAEKNGERVQLDTGSSR